MRAQGVDGLLADPLDPGLDVVADSALLQHGDELAPLAGDERPGARGVHHRGQVEGDDEHGPAHRQHAQQRAPLVESVLEVTDLERVEPRPQRQHDRRRVAGVQPDEVAGDLLDRRGRPGEVMADEQPAAALGSVEVTRPAINGDRRSGRRARRHRSRHG